MEDGWSLSSLTSTRSHLIRNALDQTTPQFQQSCGDTRGSRFTEDTRKRGIPWPDVCDQLERVRMNVPGVMARHMVAGGSLGRRGCSRRKSRHCFPIHDARAVIDGLQATLQSSQPVDMGPRTPVAPQVRFQELHQCMNCADLTSSSIPTSRRVAVCTGCVVFPHPGSRESRSVTFVDEDRPPVRKSVFLPPWSIR